MKKYFFWYIFGFAVLSCVFLTTCNNPIMEKWWPGNGTAPNSADTTTGGAGGNFGVVRFDTGGGGPQPKNLNIAWGSVVGRLRPVTRDGFGFGGWYAEDGSLWDVERTPVMEDPDNTGYGSADKNSDGFITLTARWSTDICEVTFVPYPDNSANTVEKVARGAAITQPLNPSPQDPNGSLGFAGWYTDPDFPVTSRWDFSAITSDPVMTLYAKWDSTVCTVILILNGGTRPDGSAVNRIEFAVPFSYGYVQDPGPVVKKDYSFDGWYTDPDFADTSRWDFDNSTVPGGTDTMYLYAKWVQNLYQVSFDLYPAAGVIVQPATPAVIAPQMVPMGGKIIKPDNPPQLGDGRGFTAWYADANYKRQWDFTNDSVAGNMTLYAMYQPQTRTVEFDLTGGSVQPGFQTHVTIPIVSGVIRDPGTPTRDHYTFGGWYLEPSCITKWNFTADKITVPDVIIAMDPMYLYAKWTPVTNTVTFNADLGTPAPATQTVAYGEFAQKPAQMSRTGKAFEGWFRDAAFNTEWNFDVDTVIGPVILYAKWVDSQYTVTFNLRNPPTPIPSYIKTPPPQQVIHDGVAAEPFMPPLAVNDINKYSFYRWDISDNGTDTGNLTPYDFTTPVESDITLYARWVPAVPDMVWVPRGSFIMGNSSVSGSPVAYNAFPTRRVTLDGFYISRYEITQFNDEPLVDTTIKGYVDLIQPNPSQFTVIRTRPVERVSWFDALNYCYKLSNADSLDQVYQNFTSTGTTTIPNTTMQSISSASYTMNWDADGFRLPTEAEWEYAARGGNGSPDDYLYVGSNNPDLVAWYNITVGKEPAGQQTTQRVGRMAPNSLGIYDMSGNVSEWCWDWLVPYSNTIISQDVNNPRGPDTALSTISGVNPAAQRVRRGGAWNNAAGNIRTAVRNSATPDSANWVIGFRVVRGPSEMY